MGRSPFRVFNLKCTFHAALTGVTSALEQSHAIYAIEFDVRPHHPNTAIIRLIAVRTVQFGLETLMKDRSDRTTTVAGVARWLETTKLKWFYECGVEGHEISAGRGGGEGRGGVQDSEVSERCKWKSGQTGGRGAHTRSTV